MTTDRLGAQHPSVSAALDALQRDRFCDVSREIALAAVEACGIVDECRHADEPEALVTALDEAAWAAQNSGDGVSYETAFRRARAADAWARSLVVIDRDSAAEALYEAVYAFGGDAAAEAAVVRLIRS